MTFDPESLRAPQVGAFGTASRTYGSPGMLPRPANPNSSLYGGPTPWRQSLAQYASVGAPNAGDRPFEGLGKTNVASSLPFAPPTPTLRGPGDEAPIPLGAPQPGLFEAFGGGLTALATEVLPIDVITDLMGSGLGGDFEEGAVEVMGAIGGGIDNIFDFVPNMMGWDSMPGIIGGTDIETTFNMLPDEALKTQYEAIISSASPSQRLDYMKQYLDMKGPEIARMHGASGALAELAGPSGSMSEFLRRLIFGGLMLPQQALQRTILDKYRDIDGSILNKDDADLPEELAVLKNRHLDGELSRDEFLDELLLSEHRWSNSDNFLMNLVLDTVTDPLILASFGTGAAATVTARTAATSARLAYRGALKSAISTGDNIAARALERTAKQLKTTPDDLLKSGDDIQMRTLEANLRQDAPHIIKAGKAKLSKRQRVAVELDPVIQPAAKIANEIDSLWGFFGTSKVAKRMSAFRSNEHAYGVALGARVSSVKKLQDFAGKENFDAFNRDYGIATGNLSMAIDADNMAGQVLQYERAVDQVTAANTPMLTPTDLARQSRDNARVRGVASEATLKYLKVAKQWLPKGGKVGQEAVEAALQKGRDSMAPDLARAYGKSIDEAKRFLNGLGADDLSFVHFNLYGRAVDDINVGKQAALRRIDADLATARQAGDADAVRKLEAARATVGRYTLVSENTLTKQDANTLVAALDGAADDAARDNIITDAINQYEMLDRNFNARAFESQAAKRTAFKKLLNTLIERDALVSVVEPKKVPSEVASRLSDRYRVGVAPEDVWGAVKDEAGNIVGINAFVDALSDAAPALARRIGTAQRIKSALADPIRGAQIHAKNKMNFRLTGAREFGLRKNEADRLFDAINAEAIAQKKGARAFSADELNRIANGAGVRLPEHLANQYGDRAMLHLTLTAMEGSIDLLGLSSRASAKFKTKTGGFGDNLIGKIAEDWYPKLRFSGSPIFLAMEWVEGPFFAILRGIKPSWKYTEQDIRNLRILDKLRPDYVEAGAGIGAGKLAYAGQEIALKVQDIGRWGRLYNKVQPIKAFRRPEKRIVGPRFYGVYDLKRVNYVRQAAQDAAYNFVEAMKREYPPEVFQSWASAAGSTKHIDIWTTFMEDRGWFTPGYRQSIHMFDAMRADAKDRIRMGDVASFQGFVDEAELRDAIKTGQYTRDQFNAEYAKVGANEQYVERAWRNAQGFSTEEWGKALTDALGEAEGKAAMGYFKWLANVSKRQLDEFLNDHFGDVAKVVEKSRDVPATAFRQTVKDSLDKAGMTFYARSSPEFQQAQAYMRELLPQQLVDEPKTLRRKIANAQKNIAVKGEKKHLPPANDYTRRSYDQMWEDIQSVLPNEEALYGAANWYDEMTTVFLGLTSKMDDATVAQMLKVWDENAPEGMRGSLPKDLDDARTMLAARLNVAFSGSQMNTSVLDGMRKVTTILDETLNETTKAELRENAIARIKKDAKKRKKYESLLDKPNELEAFIQKNIDTRFGFEPVRLRLESVIRDFGKLPPDAIAQKLSDFNDNLAGYLRRSSSPEDGLQPAAMDIWMKRVWGYPDAAYFDDLVRHHMTQMEAQGSPVTRAAAEKAVLKDRKWKREWVKELTEEEKKALKKQGIEEGAPTPQQYEWMLRRTNEFAQHLNKKGIPGPNGEWKAHEIQALLWVAEQKRLAYADNPTFALFNQTGRQLGLSVDPGKMNEVWRKRYPSREDLIAEFGAEGDAIMQTISYDIVSGVMAKIAERTHSTIINVLDGTEELGTTTVFGSERMSLESAHHLAAALDREVVVMGRPPDVTLKATSSKPEVSSNISGQGRHWTFDFAFDPTLRRESVQPHLTALREFLEQYLDPDEFPHALTAGLDDGAQSIRFAWDSRNNAEVSARIQQIVAEREELMATKKADRTPEAEKRIEELKKDIDRAAEGQQTLRSLKGANPLPDHVYAALEDGSWVKAFDPDADPVKIELRHEQVNYQVITPEEGVRYVNDPELVREYRTTAQEIADGSYASEAESAFVAKRRRAYHGEGPEEVFHQRELNGSNRVRAGFDYRRATGDLGDDSRIYFVRNISDASSAIHEAFHLFSRIIDPSARDEFVRAYNAAHGLSGPRGKYAKRKYTRQVEEWVAAEFEKFAAGQLAPDSPFYSTFKGFAQWAKRDGSVTAGSKIDPTFTKVMESMQDVPAGFRSLDEYRLNESARISLLKAEEDAHSTAYYRRGPNWMMRSLNHPYLGMYPANYMWGKVLPELTRFLLKRPFGLKAPLGGLQMYNHVHRAIAEELNTSEDLNAFIEGHPDTVRFLTMMLPGNPVEMPVNLPLWARRSTETYAENRMAELTGDEQQEFNISGDLADMAGYAVGFANLPDRVGDMVGEFFFDDGPNPGRTNNEPFTPQSLGRLPSLDDAV